MGLFNNLMSKNIWPYATSATATVPGAQNAVRHSSWNNGTGTGAGRASCGRCSTAGGGCHRHSERFGEKESGETGLKRSIVDSMKLVGMDSSFAARKQLAEELHYTGDPNDSASMNIWLHKEVLRKLAENGGKVPQELLS